MIVHDHPINLTANCFDVGRDAIVLARICPGNTCACGLKIAVIIAEISNPLTFYIKNFWKARFFDRSSCPDVVNSGLI